MLAKGIDGFKTINLLSKILPVYKEIIKKLSDLGAEWIQIDEPILVKDLDSHVVSQIKNTFNELKKASGSAKILVATYFEDLNEEIKDEIFASDIDAVHLDLVRGTKNNNYVKNSKKKTFIRFNRWKKYMEDQFARKN